MLGLSKNGGESSDAVDLSRRIGWSNLIKIGHPDLNPGESSWLIQADLCVEQLKYEIATMAPRAIVLLTRNFAQREVVEPVFGKDGWSFDTEEQDRVAYKLDPIPTIWMNHPRNMGPAGYRAASVNLAVELINA